jgi:Mg/Co/Ni transporter MgtE
MKNAQTHERMRDTLKTHKNALHEEIENLIDESRLIVWSNFDRDHLRRIALKMDEKIRELGLIEDAKRQRKGI